jgi:heat shock protein HspQ
MPARRRQMALTLSMLARIETGRNIRPCQCRAGKTTSLRNAKFGIGDVVRHRKYPFRGVIYDVDPVFSNTEEWWLSIPEDVRPRKDQPFYHLLAENAETEYVAYVSEQNLLPDTSGEPLRHPQVDEIFERTQDGHYRVRAAVRN